MTDTNYLRFCHTQKGRQGLRDGLHGAAEWLWRYSTDNPWVTDLYEYHDVFGYIHEMEDGKPLRTLRRQARESLENLADHIDRHQAAKV